MSTNSSVKKTSQNPSTSRSESRDIPEYRGEGPRRGSLDYCPIIPLYKIPPIAHWNLTRFIIMLLVWATYIIFGLAAWKFPCLILYLLCQPVSLNFTNESVTSRSLTNPSSFSRTQLITMNSSHACTSCSSYMTSSSYS